MAVPQRKTNPARTWSFPVTQRLDKSAAIIGETGPFRWSDKPGYPLFNVLPYCHPQVDATTITAMFQYAVRAFGPRDCLAYRTIIGRADQTVHNTKVRFTGDGEWVEDEGEPKTITQTMLSDWNWWTFDEVGLAIRRLATGLQCYLRDLGLNTGQLDVPGTLYMFADTSPQWFMISHAAALSGMPIVGVNIRLGESQFIYTVNESAPTVLFTDARSLAQLLTPLVECPSVRLVIYYLNSSVKEDLERCKLDVEAINNGLVGSVAVHSFDEVLEKGQIHLTTNEEVTVKDPERVWGIVYPPTHLHRQAPKAVVFQEKQVVASVAAIALQMHGQWKPDDRYLTHLPMYSMLEFSFIHAVLLAGYPVGFGTLQEKFLLSAPYDNGFLHPDSAGDFATFQPTFTYGIMPWWSRVADIIHNEMLGHKSAEERAQFWLWYNRKKMLLKKHIGFPAAIRHAERKAGINTIRNTLLGGRIRWIANYCSRMPKEKREFLGLVLGGERGIMIEGWTLQELNTVVTFMSPRLHDPSRGLGRPMASLEIKLKHPRGQITESQNCIYGIVCIRGPSVPLTEGTDAEGWITTDFYAKWHVHDRHLQVVRTFRDLRDRFLGDYIPIGNLEWILTRAKFVEAGILVYQGQRLDLIGVLSIKEKELREFVQECYKQTHNDLTIDEIMMLSDLKARVVKHLRKLGKEHGCAGFELVERVVMIGGSFTVENGLLLKNGQLNRLKIMEAYKDEIMYEAT